MTEEEILELEKRYEEYLMEQLREEEPLIFGFKEIKYDFRKADTIDEYIMLLIKGYGSVHLRDHLQKHVMEVLEDPWFHQWPLVRYTYAVGLLNGAGCRKNVKKALEILMSLAEQGYPNALYCVGECYMEGCGLEQSYPKAIDCWFRSYKMGYEPAKYSLKQSFFADRSKRYLELPMRLRYCYLCEAIHLYLKHFNATMATISKHITGADFRILKQACKELQRCEENLPKQAYLRAAASLFWDDDDNPYKLDV